MELDAPKPPPGQGRGVARGVLLSLFLHPVAFVVMAIVGSVTIDRHQGGLIVLPFVVFIGLVQWVYIAPTAWLFWRRGATAVAKGVLIGGGLVTLLNGLCYGLMSPS